VRRGRGVVNETSLGRCVDSRVEFTDEDCGEQCDNMGREREEEKKREGGERERLREERRK
jgi:hypothetical protein